MATWGQLAKISSNVALILFCQTQRSPEVNDGLSYSAFLLSQIAANEVDAVRKIFSVQVMPPQKGRGGKVLLLMTCQFINVSW